MRNSGSGSSRLTQGEAQVLTLELRGEITEAIDQLFELNRTVGLSGEALYRLCRLLLDKGLGRRVEPFIADVSHSLCPWVWAARCHYLLSVFRTSEALEAGLTAWSIAPHCHAAGYAYHGALVFAGYDHYARHHLQTLLATFSNDSEIIAEFLCRSAVPPNEQVHALSDLLSEHPSCRSTRFSLASAQLAMHQYEDASTNLSWLEECLGETSALCELRAMLCLQLDRVDEARYWGDKAIQQSDFCPHARFVLLSLDVRYHRITDALVHLEHVKKISGDSVLTASLLPTMLSMVGEQEQAVGHLETLRGNAFPSAEVGLGLAQLYNESGAHQEASKALEYAVLCDEGRYDVRYHLASQAYIEGNLAQAASLLAKTPDYEASEILAIDVRAALGETIDFFAEYEAHLKKYPSFDFAWGRLMRVILESGSSERLEWLLAYPRPVPIHVRHALQCAFFVKKGALPSAQSALDDYFCTIDGDERWGWSWSLIVEAVEESNSQAMHLRLQQVLTMLEDS